MIRSLTLALIATLCLSVVPDVEAGKKPRCKDGGRRCSNSAQCCGGSCCDGVCCDGACTTEGTCCSALGGELACGNECCDTFADQACCTQDPYGQRCVDVSSDPRNCGGCGNQCPGGQACSQGICFCAVGTFCNGECVETLSDPNNCGSCNHKCSDGQTCQDGQCVCTGFNSGCKPSEVCQNGQCVGVCSQPEPGSAIDGAYVACPDGNGGVVCGCNGCSEVCQFPTACCHCGCKYVITTCTEFCAD